MNSPSAESQMETMLMNLPPAIGPHFEKRLSSAPWTPRGVRRQRTLTALYLTVVLLIAFITLTPQGRAFAQSIFKFFSTTDQSSIPLSPEEINEYYAAAPTQTLSLINVTPLPLLPDDCSSPEDTYECEIKKIEKELNMDLKEFSFTPPGWAFTKIESYTRNPLAKTGMGITISYRISSGYLFLSQGEGDFLPNQAVLSSAVEPVQIGESYGEYVDGFFGVSNGDTKLTWDSTGSDQRIHWQEGERWFELLALSGIGTSGYLDKQTLISLASNMVYEPDYTQQITKISLDAIPTLPMAMKICGCEILQPTILPAGTVLDHVQYDPQWKSITLSYGYRSLRIVQTPIGSALIKDLDSYKNVENVKIGDSVGQYGISPAQKTIWESRTSPAFPVTNSYSVLLWEKDGMVYQIYFDQSFSGGGQLTKEQMIEIAESVQ